MLRRRAAAATVPLPVSSRLADPVEFLLQAHAVQRRQRQVGENIDAVRKLLKGLAERAADFFIGPTHKRRIGQAPMRRHRLPGPDRAGFVGGVIADREHEIKFGRAGHGKLIPGFAAKAGGGQAGFFDLLKRKWIGIAARCAASAVSLELSARRWQAVDDGLGHDAARGIVRAQK